VNEIARDVVHMTYNRLTRNEGAEIGGFEIIMRALLALKHLSPGSIALALEVRATSRLEEWRVWLIETLERRKEPAVAGSE
jgi:hypothetical protein